MPRKPTEKQIEHAIATMKLDPDDKKAREVLVELLGHLKTEEVYEWLEKMGPMKYAYVPEYQFPKGLLTEYQASLRPPRAYEIEYRPRRTELVLWHGGIDPKYRYEGRFGTSPGVPGGVEKLSFLIESMPIISASRDWLVGRGGDPDEALETFSVDRDAGFQRWEGTMDEHELAIGLQRVLPGFPLILVGITWSGPRNLSEWREVFKQYLISKWTGLWEHPFSEENAAFENEYYFWLVDYVESATGDEEAAELLEKAEKSLGKTFADALEEERSGMMQVKSEECPGCESYAFIMADETTIECPNCREVFVAAEAFEKSKQELIDCLRKYYQHPNDPVASLLKQGFVFAAVDMLEERSEDEEYPGYDDCLKWAVGQDEMAMSVEDMVKKGHDEYDFVKKYGKIPLFGDPPARYVCPRCAALQSGLGTECWNCKLPLPIPLPGQLNLPFVANPGMLPAQVAIYWDPTKDRWTVLVSRPQYDEKKSTIELQNKWFQFDTKEEASSAARTFADVLKMSREVQIIEEDETTGGVKVVWSSKKPD
jgi:hypothetical protein